MQYEEIWLLFARFFSTLKLSYLPVKKNDCFELAGHTNDKESSSAIFSLHKWNYYLSFHNTNYAILSKSKITNAPVSCNFSLQVWLMSDIRKSEMHIFRAWITTSYHYSMVSQYHQLQQGVKLSPMLHED